MNAATSFDFTKLSVQDSACDVSITSRSSLLARCCKMAEGFLATFFRRMLDERHEVAALSKDNASSEKPAVTAKEPVKIGKHLFGIASAFHPGDRGNSAGADHLKVLDTLDVGRLHRVRGDALCKPARKFWGLYEVSSGRKVTCKRCIALAVRLVRLSIEV